METKARIVTAEDEMAVKDWHNQLYFVNICAAHATLIQTLAQEEILQSRQLQQVGSCRMFCNVINFLDTKYIYVYRFTVC